MRDTRILVFEPFRLDVRDERLWRGDEPVRLTNKAFSVLRFLSAHPDQLVTKDELLDAVWPDAVVGEAAMTVCIRELRQALGDDAQAPRFIQTVRGRGYRFIAPVTSDERAPVLRRPEVSDLQDPALAAHPTEPPALRSPPLVGREAELACLRQWFATASGGVRQVGFVGGEAGIGKTTLVDAFVAQLGGEETLWLGRGQCVDQYGAGEAYLPLLEALGRMCRGHGGGQLLALLRRHAPSWLAQMPALVSEAERGTLLAAGSGATPARMLRELAEAIEVLTVERPLVLVLEDLHWSDASTLAWLDYVARRREVARLLVVATYRPVEAIVAVPPLRNLTQELRRAGQCKELLLDYLSEPAVAEYLEARCPGTEVPEGLAQALHERTDGNPLFLVTLLESLEHQGVLEKGPEGWLLPQGLEGVTAEVPESLRQLIEQQLEQVDVDDRTILEAASAVGAEFSAEAAAAGAGREVEEVEARCEVLARRGQFIEARGTTVWPDGSVSAQYGFLHALYPEVLYSRLPAGRRVRVHRNTGLRLEAGFGEQCREIATELAEHFVRGRDPARAVKYSARAGENARRRSAYQEAVRHLARALEMLSALPDSRDRTAQEVKLQTTLGLTFMAAKGYAAPEVGAAYSRALELCRRMDDHPQLGPVLNGLWIFHIARAELSTARAVAEEMIHLGEQKGDPGVLAPAHHGLGQVLFHAGEFAPAKEHLEQALALFARQPPSSPDAIRTVQDGRVLALGFLSFCLWHLGWPDRALEKAQEALTVARELSHPFTLTYALYFMAAIRGYRGEHAKALKTNEEMHALAAEHGFPVFVAGGLFARTLLLLAQRQMEVAEGIARLRQITDDYRATGAATGLPMLFAVVAEVRLGVGQVDEARASLVEAQAEVGRTGERRYDSRLFVLAGKLRLVQSGREQGAGGPGNKVAEAEALIRRGIDVARKQGAKSLELQAALALSRLWLEQGRRIEARDLLAGVYRSFTEGFETADLQAARALLDRIG